MGVSYEQLCKHQAKVGSHQVMTKAQPDVCGATSFLGRRRGNTSEAWTGFSPARTLRIRATTLAPLQAASNSALRSACSWVWLLHAPRQLHTADCIPHTYRPELAKRLI